MKIALCLLTWNELQGCKHDIPIIDRTKFNQVFSLDGGSEDGTIEYLESIGVNVVKQKNKGLNNAYKEAIDYTDCDAVVFFHPKGSVPVDDIYKFKNYFEKGFELIVASRMAKDSINEEDDKLFKPRKWFGLFLALWAMILYKREGNVIWDSLHGFRGVTVSAFDRMNISDMSPSVDIEMVCRSYKNKVKRIEFSTKESNRLAGSTHFKAFSAGKILIKYMLWEMFRK